VDGAGQRHRPAHGSAGTTSGGGGGGFSLLNFVTTN
jgi:hypothetical protein